MTDTLQEQPSRATEVGRSRAEESLPVPGAAAPTRKRVVIVGGGFAGIAAAHALRHADVEIVLIDRRNHHIFQPLLYQVATAAFTGMRLSELKGLRWENYDGKELHVAQSIWHGIVSDPKTRKSRAAVPVIEPLTRLLERHRVETGNPTSGWIFTQNFEYLAGPRPFSSKAEKVR
jgi:integrase